MRLAAKFLSIIIALILVLSFSKTTFAQTTTPLNYQAPQYLAPNTNPGVPQNLHTYTQNLMIEVMSATICQITGVDPTSPNQPCLGIDTNSGKIGFVNNGGGAIGSIAYMIQGLYTVPVRFGDYVAYSIDSFGIAKPTYAAEGAGFFSLSPILNVWKTFRDITYLFFVAVFLIIGIAIMLRVRIDPRTVMTIQNQIPKLIIGILLVTFSFAIAGFLIDVMWIGNYVIIKTLQPSTTLGSSDEVVTQSMKMAPDFANYVFEPQGVINLGGILNVVTQSSNEMGNLVQSMFGPGGSEILKLGGTPEEKAQAAADQLNHAASCFGINPFCLVGDLVNGSIGDLMGQVIGTVVNWIVKIIAFLIIAIAVLWALIRLWFNLIKAYVMILIDVILAPFWIIAGLIPGAGQSVGFGPWIRDLLGNLVAFPATIALFMLGKVIYDNFQGLTSDTVINGVNPSFNPPLIGYFGSQTGGPGIGPIIALGIILMSPNIVEMTKKAFKTAGLPSGFGGLKMGQAVVGGFVGGSMARIFRRDQQGNAVGVGSIWLSQRRNRVVRGFGHIMGWRTEEETRSAAEGRSRSGETTPLAQQPNPTPPQNPPPAPQGGGNQAGQSGLTAVRRRTRP